MGGVLSALFFLGFLFLIGLYQSFQAILFLGFLFVIAGIAINRAVKSILLDTISISFYLIGLALVGVGIQELFESANAICLVFIIIAIVALLVSEGYFINFISFLVINFSFFVLLSLNVTGTGIHVFTLYNLVLLLALFLHESVLITIDKKLNFWYNPLKIASIISFYALLINFGHEAFLFTESQYGWISTVFIALAIFFAVYRILQSYEFSAVKLIGIYLCQTVVLVPTYYFPSIAGAILVLLLSVHIFYKTGIMVGILGLIYFTGLYYYDLSLTLLFKSMVMTASGAVFIVAYFFINKVNRNEK